MAVIIEPNNIGHITLIIEETIFDLKIGDAEDQLCELSEENEWIQNK